MASKENLADLVVLKYLEEKEYKKAAKYFCKESKVSKDVLGDEIPSLISLLPEEKSEKSEKVEKSSKRKRKRDAVKEESGSDEESIEVNKKEEKKARKKKSNKKSKSTPNETEENKEAEDQKVENSGLTNKEKRRKKNKNKKNTPFKRIEEDTIEIKHAELADNTYDAKFAKGGDAYGFMANKVLSAVRGKDFRHEKTKKKRGTYRGAKINPDHVASFKFHYDSDE